MDVLPPLGLLLRQARAEYPDAEEVLLFTFNQDLAFFERCALGVVQDTGGRITVVADAGITHHDVYAVRRAGTAYLPGLAQCDGSFHPKVIVIAGRERATVAIGSGNLSLPGWQGNDELWSVHHATADEGSSVVEQTTAWLRSLPEVVLLSDGVADAVERTATLLDPLAATDTTASMVHSLHSAIIDQLPPGPVDELSLFAPFLDAAAEAVGQLMERLKPAKTTVAIQPGLTRLDGAALAARLGGVGEILTLADSPYRHGKLIEWASNGHRWALTGSPNLSRAALLMATVDGGNVETAVVSPISGSLMPQGKRTRVHTIESLPYVRRTDDRSPAVIVMSAVRQPDGTVTVTLARPLTQDAVIEASRLGESPDHWRQIAALDHDAHTAVIAADVPGGSRIRVRLADGSLSQPQFVIDPSKVLRKRAAPSGGRKPPELEEVFRDPRAFEQLVRILDELRKSDGRLMPSISRPASPGMPARSFEVGDWEEYLDRCQGRVGLSTLSFALGIPLPKTQGGALITDTDWDDEGVDDDAVGNLEEDEPGDLVEDETTAAFTAVSLRRATEPIRRRYRTAADRMIHAWDDPDPHERLLALRAVLLLVAAGTWDVGDRTWIDLLLDGIASLDIDESPTEYEDLAGSLAAVALSIVDSTLGTGERTLTHNRFDQASASVEHLLVAANREAVEGYAEGLQPRFPAGADTDIVLGLRDRLVNKDPVFDAVTMLHERGIEATADGRVIDLPKPAPDPLLPAFEVLAHADTVSPVVIRSSGTKGWVTLLWHAPRLIVVRSGAKPGTMFCHVYDYPPDLSPSIDIRTDGQPNGDRIVERTIAGQALPASATEILHMVGLNLPGPDTTHDSSGRRSGR